MIRALLVDGSIGTTGALLAAVNTARALGDQGEVVLILDRDALIDAEVRSEFHATEQIRLCLPRRSLASMLGYVFGLPVSAVRLRLLCGRYNADAVIFNDFYFAQTVLLRFLGYRGRIVTWVRMDPRRFGRLGAFWIWLAKVASDQIVAVSQHIRQIIATVPDVSVIFDPVPLRSSAANDLSAEMRNDADFPVFVFVGNYIEGKGQDLALRALAKAREQCPAIRVKFYGGDLGQARNRSYRDGLRRFANELGVGEAVAFNDFAANPMTVLENKRGALILSRSESFSMTALEASSAGVPVIATRCGGPEEIVADNETGFLVGVDDISGTAAAMCRLATEPALAEGMGVAGRERVSALFSEAQFRSQVLKVLNLK